MKSDRIVRKVSSIGKYGKDRDEGPEENGSIKSIRGHFDWNDIPSRGQKEIK